MCTPTKKHHRHNVRIHICRQNSHTGVRPLPDVTRRPHTHTCIHIRILTGRHTCGSSTYGTLTRALAPSTSPILTRTRTPSTSCTYSHHHARVQLRLHNNSSASLFSSSRVSPSRSRHDLQARQSDTRSQEYPDHIRRESYYGCRGLASHPSRHHGSSPQFVPVTDRQRQLHAPSSRRGKPCFHAVPHQHGPHTSSSRTLKSRKVVCPFRPHT